MRTSLGMVILAASTIACTQADSGSGGPNKGGPGAAAAPNEAPSSAPAGAPTSGPASKPSSRSSLPSGHSTSSVAIDLERLFRMPATPEDVVLTVGAAKIARTDLEATLRSLQIEVDAAGAPENLTRYEVLRSAVDRLAELARRRQLAEELEIKLDQTKVKAWLDDLEGRMKANPSFEVFLLRAGKDAATRRKDAERAVRWRQVQDAIFAQVLADSESLAREYYDAHPDAFKERAGVEAWRILLKAPRGMVQRDRDIARTRAEKIHAEAKAHPDRFEDLAKHHSEGGKGPHGGFIGWIAKGTLKPELEKALFAAKPNTVLPLQDAPVGFYIYKAGRSRPERVKAFDEVKADILRQVYPARVAKRVTEHMKRLDAKYPAEPNIPELAQLEIQEQKRRDEIRAKIEARSQP